MLLKIGDIFKRTTFQPELSAKSDFCSSKSIFVSEMSKVMTQALSRKIVDILEQE